MVALQTFYQFLSLSSWIGANWSYHQLRTFWTRNVLIDHDWLLQECYVVMKRYGCIILISNPTISHSRKTLQIPIMNVLDCGLTSKLSETLLYKISIYFFSYDSTQVCFIWLLDSVFCLAWMWRNCSIKCSEIDGLVQIVEQQSYRLLKNYRHVLDVFDVDVLDVDVSQQRWTHIYTRLKGGYIIIPACIEVQCTCCDWQESKPAGNTDEVGTK